MANRNGNWDPTEPRDWASALGLVNIPLFGSGAKAAQKRHSVLLDGRRLSFVLLSGEDPEARKTEALSWTWSTYVNHAVIIDAARGDLFLRGWSSHRAPMVYDLPTSARDAVEFLKRLEDIGPPSEPSAIAFVLEAFRLIRDVIPHGDGLDSVRVFNAMLVGTDLVRRGKLSENAWLASDSIGDAIDQLPKIDREITEATDIGENVRRASLHQILKLFLRPDPITGCHLEPALLLRHAAGQLYQEAHLQLEREDASSLFPGIAVRRITTEQLRPDVRFTPTNLARALVWYATELRSKGCKMGQFDALDPACGSGVFLQEIMRELEDRKFKGRVKLRGFDTSKISCAMARFALRRAIRDAGPDAVKRYTVSVTEENALPANWGRPDVVLMNPPFVGFREMSEDERKSVVSVLVDATGDDTGKGRPDMAMAFAWKAAACLKNDAVMASVLPAPLLENSSGVKWREAMVANRALRLVGRFEDYGIFSGAIVEPAVIVIQNAKPDASEVKVLYARENYKDVTIRALRTGSGMIPGKAEVYEASPRVFTAATWLPRSAALTTLMVRLALQGFPRVEGLFEVQQGAITGRNDVFVVTRTLIRGFKLEQRYFRPIASNSTISEGRIEGDEFVWYPYDDNGPEITDVAALQTKALNAYNSLLYPSKSALIGRARIDESNWWLLSEHRAWQRRKQPKLVSTYFGRRGSFAYDEKGECVVLQGYGWTWKERGHVEQNDFDEIEGSGRVPFHNSPLPWAYLALLNSDVFEVFLEYFCPRVQGGQFNLSDRFVKRVFIPDLSDEKYQMDDTISALAKIGRAMHSGSAIDPKALRRVSARAYHVHAEELGLGG